MARWKRIVTSLPPDNLLPDVVQHEENRLPGDIREVKRFGKGATKPAGNDG
jgi:hypothetical protein